MPCFSRDKPVRELEVRPSRKLVDRTVGELEDRPARDLVDRPAGELVDRPARELVDTIKAYAEVLVQRPPLMLLGGQEDKFSCSPGKW